MTKREFVLRMHDNQVIYDYIKSLYARDYIKHDSYMKILDELWKAGSDCCQTYFSETNENREILETTDLDFIYWGDLYDYSDYRQRTI